MSLNSIRKGRRVREDYLDDIKKFGENYKQYCDVEMRRGSHQYALRTKTLQVRPLSDLVSKSFQQSSSCEESS